MGAIGAQGAAGQTGYQGYSTVGPVGPAGPIGPVGAQGLAGVTGAQGATLVGPTGAVGSSGDSGAQGSSGATGARGVVMAGGAGGAGIAGPQGVQGPVGPMGAPGVVGVVATWTEYRDFTFDEGRADLRGNDQRKANEISAYLVNNPSLQVAIDGTMDTRNQNLGAARVTSVRSALLQAGVPDYKIQQGAFADPQLSHDGRVKVLISTQ
jgi:hypothetical protein